MMNTGESMECTRRRGRELGLSAGTVTTPREGPVTSTFCAAHGEGNVTVDREGGSEASWSGTPEDDWMSGLGGEVYDGRRVRGETVRRRMKPSSCQIGSWCRVNSGSDRGGRMGSAGNFRGGGTGESAASRRSRYGRVG